MAAMVGTSDANQPVAQKDLNYHDCSLLIYEAPASAIEIYHSGRRELRAGAALAEEQPQRRPVLADLRDLRSGGRAAERSVPGQGGHQVTT